jgi:hypothetical protein
VLQYAREQHLTGDAAAMAEILSVIQTHVCRWPTRVQQFLFSQLATIGETATQPSEVA